MNLIINNLNIKLFAINQNKILNKLIKFENLIIIKHLKIHQTNQAKLTQTSIKQILSRTK